jgi:predicted homoserine dehydrogenase-like protein
LIPQAPVVDTVTVAKRTLTPGDDIDGIGGHSVYGTVESAEVAREEDLVPISLVEGATVTSAIDRGQPLRYNDVELRDSDLFHLRMLQDSYF